jgi:hypothetical protein
MYTFLSLSSCARPAAIRSFDRRGLAGGVIRRVPGLGVTIAPSLGVQYLSLCNHFALQRPRHLAPRAGAKHVHVEGSDPIPVLGFANLGSTLTVAFGWFLFRSKSSSGVGRSPRTVRKIPLWPAGYKTCPRIEVIVILALKCALHS